MHSVAKMLSAANSTLEYNLTEMVLAEMELQLVLNRRDDDEAEQGRESP